MTSVFIVFHSHEFEDGSEDTKLIGVYASYQDAEAAIARVADKPGFKDFPDDFTIGERTLGEDSWTEGFISWEEASGEADK